MEKIARSNTQDVLDLNMVQKSMLFHYLKETQANLYNVQLSLVITGVLDVTLLQQAIAAVQANNEVLRSVFRWEHISKPVQIILKECPITFDYHDKSMLPNEEKDAFIVSFLSEDMQQRFDMRKVPLRLALIQTARDSFVFVVTHHHMLYDGWSTGIFLKEIFQCYKTLSDGGTPVFPGKAAYRALQVPTLTDEIPEKSAAFWKTYLTEYETFPSSFGEPPPAAEIKKCTRASHDIDLDAFSRKHAVTKAAVIYTAFGILLQQYNNVSDVVFGTVVSNRAARVKGGDLTMGNFINTLPLRLHQKTDESLLEAVVAVNRSLIERSSFTGTSYPEIKQMLHFPPSEQLFDTLVAIENYPLEENIINGNAAFEVRLNTVVESTSIPLALTVFLKNGVAFDLAYRSGLMPDGMAESMCDHLLGIITAIIDRPEEKTETFSLLSATE
ncbi:condensation domain-containing protein, partial [Chitinophaga varians]|uniref:condensation domain-containing protein n=1 Tax=Chitinophaga varians TaxID=2202339 RepID=UPI00165FAA88|nr:hypothetical protein [Chitinophaga varians]